MSVIDSSDLIGRAPGGRKLIAVLYADMVGYSRLIGLDDLGTLERLRTLRGTLIDPAANDHGGRIVQTGGDSLLIVFDSIDGAVRCAVQIQQQVPGYNADHPADRAIRFRVGINIADVIADGTDLHGDGVNVAARLQAECPSGGICVSRAVRDHVHGRLDLAFDALGALILKIIARPVEAFVLRDSGPATQQAPGDNDPPSSPAIEPPPLCLGRDAQIGALLDALTGPSDVNAVVVGPAGIGKTTLSRQVASTAVLAARFGDRLWFVELETAPDAASMRQRIVLGLGLDAANPAGFDLACQRLGEAPGLLVLDNLETPWEADMAKAEADLRRLAAIRGLSLLVSVRGNTAPGGPVFALQITLTPLAGADARALFHTYAPNIQATDPHLTAFLNGLGGIPLAIELVARRAARQPEGLSELWQQYLTRGPVLARHPHLPEGRLTSVVQSLDLSWQSPRLHEPGRRLFRLLGCSPAGLAHSDRQALLGEAALEAAEQLIEVGLAVAKDGRMDLLPPVRGYALALQPATAEEADEWRWHFLALAKALGEVAWQDGSGALIERLSPGAANLEAALTVAAERHERLVGIDAGVGYQCLARCTGLCRPAPLLLLASACLAVDDQGQAAKCLEWTGEIALARSEHEEARTRFNEARPLHHRVGAVVGEANCTKGLGDIAMARSQHDEALTRYDEARSLYHRVGNVLGEANCVRRLGSIALARSEHDEAWALYNEAHPLYHRIGDVRGEANCIKGRGDIALARSEYNEARARYEEARSLYHRVGAVFGEANCIKGLGDVSVTHSEYDEARARYEEARSLYHRIGDVVGEANCIQGLGDIALAGGEQDAACKAWTEALVLYRRIPDPSSIGQTHLRLARNSAGSERAAHVAAARAAWESIKRPDLATRYLSDLS
jgi:class 3 adenylate cyclase/tetratricopeptide (TPR) repeat protein